MADLEQVLEGVVEKLESAKHTNTCDEQHAAIDAVGGGLIGAAVGLLVGAAVGRVFPDMPAEAREAVAGAARRVTGTVRINFQCS